MQFSPFLFIFLSCFSFVLFQGYTKHRRSDDMPAAHKGALVFGMVYIPIELHKTTRDHEISFNQLCKDTKERVRYKKICPSTDKEVTTKDIVKGYQYEKDNYVIMTEEELEQIKTERDKSIHILQVSKLEEINDLYYEKNYYVIPVKGGEKAYQLLYQTLLQDDRVAIAKTVLGTKEQLMALCPKPEGLIAKILFYDDEVVDVPKDMKEAKLTKEEMKMAKLLVDSMYQPFVASQYQDEYQERLKEAINKKIKGEKIVTVRKDEAVPVSDLMDALQKSLQMSKKPAAAKEKKTKTKAKATTRRKSGTSELAS